MDCGERIISEDYADFILDLNTIDINQAPTYDLCYDILYGNLTVAYAAISTLPENIFQLYGYSVFPSCFGLMDLGSLEASGVTRIRNIQSLNLGGNGVIIGIIDTGIDYTHEAFRNADGTSKIVSIWDQTIQNRELFPEGFFYGSEYTQEQINSALASPDPLSVVPSTDEIGHGTFLAGIAAGNPNITAGFSGVAPNAELIVVKLKQAKRYIRDYFLIPQDAICYQENDIMLGVKYILNAARQLGRPLSLCIGLGTSQGAHDSRGSLSSYLSTISDERGVGVTIAAGNEGNRGHHYMGIVDPAIGYDTVELRVGPDTSGFSMELWGNSPNLFSIDILSPSGEYIPRIPARLRASQEIRFIFEQTVIQIDYELVESQTGDELILMRFRSPTEGIWRFRVYSVSNLEPVFHIWLPVYPFINEDTIFTEPNPDYTLTSPANTYVTIISTAYDYTNRSLYLNASRGYTRTNFVSPSFAAPGVNLIGPALNNGYTTNSGTSIAAAHTAGVVALLLEWSVTLNPYPFKTIEMKNIFLLGANRDPNAIYPNREWGYGILDVYNSFLSLRGA